MSDMISVKDQDRAYAAYMGHSAEWIVEALRKGPDPALEQLVTWAIRSAQLEGPAGPGNVSRPPESEREQITTKEQVDKLIAGEWEILSNALFSPGEYAFDKNAWRYFKRQIEFALWLLQNIQILRGGKGNWFWFSENDTPEVFWAEYERWVSDGAHFIDPETARWEKEREGKQ